MPSPTSCSPNRILKGPGLVIPLIFPKVPQSSQTESSKFPSYALPLDTPSPLKNPIITLPVRLVQMSLLDFASLCTTLDLDLPLLGGEDWPLLLAHLLPGGNDGEIVFCFGLTAWNPNDLCF